MGSVWDVFAIPKCLPLSCIYTLCLLYTVSTLSSRMSDWRVFYTTSQFTLNVKVLSVCLFAYYCYNQTPQTAYCETRRHRLAEVSDFD